MLTGTSTSGQSRLEINGNEEVLHTLQNPWNVVWYHTQDTKFFQVFLSYTNNSIQQVHIQFNGFTYWYVIPLIHLPPVTKTIQARRTRHAGHCWRSKDEIVSDVLLWTPAYGQSKAGRPARTYIQQLCDDTGCNPEDLPEAMNDRETWRERVRDIRASRTTWWWCLHTLKWFQYCKWLDNSI